MNHYGQEAKMNNNNQEEKDFYSHRKEIQKAKLKIIKCVLVTGGVLFTINLIFFVIAINKKDGSYNIMASLIMALLLLIGIISIVGLLDRKDIY